ncbi:MAG: VIT1/CCC1 transporter family protein [Gammaproteobacteria bacterium]|nr:VIT1/CCC1 transporter family protein [Gammaproteobacteria bacterium]
MLSRWLSNKPRLADLSEQEIIALAISSEEEDASVYLAFASQLREDYPASAKVFEGMAEEEHTHRNRLIELHRARFGEAIPLVRRDHVRDFPSRTPVWLTKQLSLEKIREVTERMEADAHRFYTVAASQCLDASTRKLLGDLALEEVNHETIAAELCDEHTPSDVRQSEDDKAHRQFVLTYVQPGLAGLMDGSVSTLAPIFAAAFATGDTMQTFRVGLAASIGAGISMGFTEVASDDGVISGRGSPIKRGLATGIMTTIGGLGHALPYLIPDFNIATTLAVILVFVELWVITWIQNKYMDTPWSRATLQVVVGGALVFAAGMLIGNA